MYIAMNRFQIVPGRETEFELIWRQRESLLEKVPGFNKFHLIKGKTTETHTIYASHSTWDSQSDFLNWTKSESFSVAHKNAGKNKGLYIGHPIFEGFEVIL